MKNYVLGFLFSTTLKEVVLIEKQKPVWMKGFLNGVGGHIEDFDATPAEAMYREFLEETGVEVHTWSKFAVLFSEFYTMHCFKAFHYQEFFDAKTMEAEKIVKAEVNPLPNNVLHNLRWLIPIALDSDIREAQLIRVS